MSLTGAGKVAGVVGWPIAHSLSPLLHGYWLWEYQIDGALVPLAVRPEDFATVIAGLRKAGFTGVNVTVPHKQAAFALAHACDEAAKAAGAANLLAFSPDGRILARNTDAGGLRDCLRESLGELLSGREVLLLGAGGAARGAVLALNDLGVRRIHILNRHGPGAAAVANQMKPLVQSQLLPGDLAAWPEAAANAALLLNATSAGMKGAGPLALDLAPLAREAAICDIVYNPLETDLLRRARARGHLGIDGLGMLMHQAVTSFEVFFGVRPAVSPGLRQTLEQALNA